ncbi:MAG: Tryptophanase, partial [Streblomastix strix]
VGFTIELIRRFGIRACELGAFAFEYDNKDEEERKGIINLIRFAVPRNQLNYEHIRYTAAAAGALFRDRANLPKVRITRGQKLRLRHFQAALEPIYPDVDVVDDTTQIQAKK